MQANLGLLKVLVAKSQAEGLQMCLGNMVEGLLRWQDDTKNHFKSKVCVELVLYFGHEWWCLSEFVEEISFLVPVLQYACMWGVGCIFQEMCLYLPMKSEFNVIICFYYVML